MTALALPRRLSVALALPRKIAELPLGACVAASGALGACLAASGVLRACVAASGALRACVAASACRLAHALPRRQPLRATVSAILQFGPSLQGQRSILTPRVLHDSTLSSRQGLRFVRH